MTELFNNEEILKAWLDDENLYYYEDGKYHFIDSLDTLISMLYHNEDDIFAG